MFTRAIFVMLLAASFVVAAEPDFDTLVKELGNESYQVRSAAHEALEASGLKAKPYLEQAKESKEPEIRLRVKSLLNKIYYEELWLGGQVKTAKTMKLSEAVAILNEETGNQTALGDQYGAANDPDENVSLETGEYWKVLDSLCAQSKNILRTNYSTYNNDPHIVICTSNEPQNNPIAYAGPFRFKMEGAIRTYRQDFSFENLNDDVTHNFTITLKAAWESRVKLIASGSPRIEEAVTDGGVKCRQPGQTATTSMIGNNRELTATVSIFPPPLTSKKFVSIKGVWTMFLLGDFTKVAIKKLAAEETVYQDDVAVRILSVDLETEPIEISLLVTRDLAPPDPAEISHQELSFALYDTNGEKMTEKTKSVDMTEDGVQVTLKYETSAPGPTQDDEDQPPGPRKAGHLEVGYPKIRGKRDVPFEFTNVPLPNGEIK